MAAYDSDHDLCTTQNTFQKEFTESNLDSDFERYMDKSINFELDFVSKEESAGEMKITDSYEELIQAS